ncbi:hypothetical protein DRB05_06825 [Pseudoalteromonas sp. A757]|nr:hypothetical protein DRB05_06825 [Pseudoalteromonas sp. A757]
MNNMLYNTRKMIMNDMTDVNQFIRKRFSTNLFLASSGTPSAQELADAINANNAILNYCNGILNTKIPVLPDNPEWYQNFQKSFASAKIHALDWFNVVAYELKEIPQSIVSYGFIFKRKMKTINDALDILVDNPKDKEAKEQLTRNIENLIDSLNDFVEISQGFHVKLQNFEKNMESDNLAMKGAIVEAEKQKEYDEKQVQSLLKDIEELEKEIESKNQIIAGAGIGAGVSFFAGAVIGIFTFGLGIAFGIIGAVAGIATIIVEQAQIKVLQLKIKSKTSEMDDYNSSIAALKILSQNLSKLTALAKPASTQIKMIEDVWDTLIDELKQVVSDLKSGQYDLDQSKYKELRNDLQMADDDWLTVSESAKILADVEYFSAKPKEAVIELADAG